MDMNLDSHDLGGEETEDILAALIKYVVKSDEELRKDIENETSGTELKVFVAENRGYELGTLDREIRDLIESPNAGKYIQDFISGHTFSEELLNDEVSYVEIHTANYERTDQFIFFDDDDYLKILTAERRDWTKKTVERLLEYLPSLDRLFLSSDDLRDIVDDLPKTTISGFTAKYYSYETDQSVTIQFHGGSEADLQKVEDEFGARPTRLEFDQANSPSVALKSSIDRNGYFKLMRVRRGSEAKGLETLEEIFDDYERHDREHFEIDSIPKRVPVKNGFTIEGFTTLRLLEQDSQSSKTPLEELEEAILSKRRYEFTEWEPGNYLVFDTEHNEPFEIGIEGRDLAIYAKEATTSVTLREFCNLILEDFNSSYRLDKTSEKLRG
jgi:hypothetical protein